MDRSCIGKNDMNKNEIGKKIETSKNSIPKSYNLDKNDIMILDALKENSKLSMHKLSKKTGIPITTIYNHIKKLENNEIIKKYSIVVDEKKLGKKLKVYMLIHYDISIWGKDHPRNYLQKALLSLPDVEEISYILGRFDILLKIRVRDIEELNEIILTNLRKIPGIGQTETFAVLEEVK